MSILNYKNKTLQVLISTMNRSNLEFLDSIFVNNNISNSLITIINQTKKNTISCDNNKSIQIFNSSEFGLSYSRNLAIKNSTNDYCLIADDDVVYVKNFDKIKEFCNKIKLDHENLKSIGEIQFSIFEKIVSAFF